MIQSYDLYLPTHLVFGKGRVSELGNLIKGYGKKVLLTYGGGSVKRIGLYDTVKKILTDAGCEIFELSGIAPNPKIESVRAGVEICKKEGIEFIVSIGGGSTLDCSKAISCGAFYDGDPWDLVIHNDRIGRHLPIFDVITLAATGSEYDGGGVITNEETKEKLSVGGCYPVASILNPEYTFTVPANQTAAGISVRLPSKIPQTLRPGAKCSPRRPLAAAGSLGLAARRPPGPATGLSMRFRPGTTLRMALVSRSSPRTGWRIR